MIQPDFLHKYPKEYEITNFHHHLEYLLLFSRHFRLKKDDDSDISCRFIHLPRRSMSSCTIKINQMYVNITYIEFLKMYLKKNIWDSHIMPPYHKQILGKLSFRTKKGTFCSVDGI